MNLRISSVLCIFAILSVSVSAPLCLAASPAAISLDPLFQPGGIPVSSAAELSAQHPHLKVPRVAVLPQASGFNRIPRAGGPSLTLFGLPVDEMSFVFRRDGLRYASAAFLNRGRAVATSQADFEDLVELCIKAVSAMTRVAPVNEREPDRAGAVASQWCRWPGTPYFLNYSYRTADATRRIPFRAEYISLRLPTRQ